MGTAVPVHESRYLEAGDGDGYVLDISKESAGVLVGEFLEDFIVHEDDVRFRIRKALKKVKIAPRGENDMELPVGIQDLFQ